MYTFQFETFRDEPLFIIKKITVGSLIIRIYFRKGRVFSDENEKRLSKYLKNDPTEYFEKWENIFH